MMKLRGFTLIELLVVIAILSILAAILFPVFAAAKQAGKKALCVNNLRQIAVANQLYLNDNESQYQSAVYSYSDDAGDPLGPVLQTYLKSSAVMYCPNRFDKTCVTYGNPAGNCFGYGYNWGFYSPWDDGTGLLYPEAPDPNASEGFIQIGKNESALADPSKTFLAGDTWSTPDYQLAPFDWNGPGSARHADRFNFAYADTHVRTLAMRHGITPAEPILIGNLIRRRGIGKADSLTPSSPKDLLGYCTDQDGADCKKIAQWFLTNTTFDGQK